jgi:Putative Mg2+ and Co2+ transporter CorB
MVFWIACCFVVGVATGLGCGVWWARRKRTVKHDEKAINPSYALVENLAELANHCLIDDVMIPRPNIQAVNLNDKSENLWRQITTSHYSHLPVYEETLDQIVGVLDLRDALRLATTSARSDKDALRALLQPAYYIPSGTPLLKQWEEFRLNSQRLGLVVDEYGELLGLVTPGDMAHEIASTLSPGEPLASAHSALDNDGLVIDASQTLRTLNRQIDSDFPLDGPKTLSGLIIEYLGKIPDAGVEFSLCGFHMVVMQIRKHQVRVVKLRRLPMENVES